MEIHRATMLFSLLAVTFSLLNYQPILAVQSSPSSIATDFIRTSCNTTLYADVCYATLSRYADAAKQDPAQLAKLAISVALSKTRAVNVYISTLSSQAAAIQDCASTLGDAVEQMHNSVKQLRRLGGNNGGGSVSNVQTWMSAALTNEGTCIDGIEEAGDESTDVSGRVVYLKKLTSNALALVNLYANKSQA